MKFVSFKYQSYESLGIIQDNNVFDIFKLSNNFLPNNMEEYLKDFSENNSYLSKIIANKKNISNNALKLDEVTLLSPIKKPNSFRDAYAFRKHVEAGRKSRGLNMIPEYDKFPVFYFSNHNSIIGGGDVFIQERHLEKLDFEFEIGLLICKEGRNIKSKDAYKHVAGLMIMNDWSARGLQFEEMKLNLGPAKGKDFATSIGPCLVTLDELKKFIIESENGFSFDLEMRGYVNGKLISKDNMKNMTWTFSQIIERVSYGVTLYPGDLIGSGTCSTGCFLELNIVNNTDVWLKEGDVVRLDIEHLGSLENKIIIVK